MSDWRTNHDGNKFPTSPNLKRFWQVFVIFNYEGQEFEQEFGVAESDHSKAEEIERKAKEFYPTARTDIRPLDLETEY